MRDIGPFIWFVLITIGVISSITRSARRANAQRASTPAAAARQAPRPVPPPARTMPSGVVQAPPGLPPGVASFLNDLMQQQPIVAPAPKPVPPPPAPAPPKPPVAPQVAVKEPVRRAPGWFGDRSSVVRAVIAAEVLGKPIALRDE